uniref:Fibronectin type III domain-containing protein n=1 Tax=Candidatus Kentrum eta TaxID=2126337 RepID=A0A450UJM5_9GAMM|nr:MAG: hypothetical protein BECKH772A_GA0070896_1001613 [Candidatus Kentron sp. H]VFJ92749.1 MAG: hypothetical protein BECKH772B_GA0070898_100336 [Candidatus Kentron sp. H]VFJ97603.1 MAG: hypothetical protein BECKH772C_GA0070978_1001412 [Candidatus Kentron sp. H]
MARFPDDESKILELAKNMVRGLTDPSALYPDPPTPPLDLDTKVDAYEQAKEDIAALQAALKVAFDAKETIVTDLTDQVKRNLRYAGNTVGDDDAKLSLIGWGARRPPTALEAPGQAGSLKATEQGGGEEDWALVKTTLDTEVTLTGQTRGKELEYRVVAMNRAGQGGESNTVAAVL